MNYVYIQSFFGGKLNSFVHAQSYKIYVPIICMFAVLYPKLLPSLQNNFPSQQKIELKALHRALYV